MAEKGWTNMRVMSKLIERTHNLFGVYEGDVKLGKGCKANIDGAICVQWFMARTYSNSREWRGRKSLQMSKYVEWMEKNGETFLMYLFVYSLFWLHYEQSHCWDVS